MRGLTERIELKTPEQIALMRAGRLVVARALRGDGVRRRRRACRLRIWTRSPARCCARRARRSSFLGYHGFPGGDLRVGQRPRRARHPLGSTSELARRRPDLDRLRRDRRRLARRRRDHGAGRRGDRRGRQPCRRPARRSHVGRASPQRGTAAGSATSRTPSRRSVRESGRYGIVAGYGGHGIGSQMHMAPHILNYGPAGKGPRLVAGMAAGDRADDHSRISRTPRSWPTAGRWPPSTGRWRRTGSTPSPSWRTARGCSPRRTAAGRHSRPVASRPPLSPIELPPSTPAPTVMQSCGSSRAPAWQSTGRAPDRRKSHSRSCQKASMARS